MKKLLFTTLCILIASLSTITLAQAQDLKIDEFIKKHASQKGSSYVEMSKIMLDATFSRKDWIGNMSWPADGSHPITFKSLVLPNNKANIDELKSIITADKYEVLMELKSQKQSSKTKENIEISTIYYFRVVGKADDKEVIIIQEAAGEELPLTYMRGNLNPSFIRIYLTKIREQLSSMNISSAQLKSFY